MVSAEAVKRDLALSLISSRAYSRWETTPPSTSVDDPAAKSTTIPVEMSSRDGFFDNKLLDDFGYGVM
uniref:Uncharacterized protein n=1 Tax=Oryza sativa subsp. japonica TaxID=39947 RepID=Q6ESN3_ORYSJ|nr:hypothetical protein [Oryza sativa Japonica Group]